MPTTLGKEFSVFAHRLLLITKKLNSFKFSAKFNGAVGGYHALAYSYPKVNWLAFSKEFINSFELEFDSNTTQINASADLVELFSILNQINNILLDLNQDMWRYISDDWIVQTGKKKYIGSSTMPQKINPIEFENSEGNIMLANSLFIMFMQKLPISRLQRDLSSSTVIRNIGSAFTYTLLAYKSLIKGLTHIVPNKINISKDLNKNWNILAEAMQTIARKKGDQKAYEKIANLSKKQVWSRKDWQRISKLVNFKLGLLTPDKYIGLSKELAQETVVKINSFLKKNE